MTNKNTGNAVINTFNGFFNLGIVNCFLLLIKRNMEYDNPITYNNVADKAI